MTDDQRLGPEEQRQFRAGLGLALYVAQDRPDIQQSLKTLATYMAAGTKQALKALRHVGSYLKGTQGLGILLPMTDENVLICDVWKKEDWEQRRDRARYNVETFADANRAGCRVTRKSTSSYMIFVNGCLINSSCKLQSTIALSSGESELYAACSGLAESLQAVS